MCLVEILSKPLCRAVFLKLLLLFVAVPIVELFLLLVISKYVLDPLMTIALVIVTGIVGAWLAQWQGTRAFGRIRSDLAAGKMPTDSVVDALLIFVAGAFLMTPGILTDIFGFTLLVPAGRNLVRYCLAAWFKSHFKIESFPAGARFGTEDGVIDSYTVDAPTTDEGEQVP